MTVGACKTAFTRDIGQGLSFQFFGEARLCLTDIAEVSVNFAIVKFGLHACFNPIGVQSFLKFLS